MMAVIKTTKYFFGKILHSQVLSSMDILFLKREFLKLWKWPRQTAKSFLCVGLNVSNGLETEANCFQGAGGKVGCTSVGGWYQRGGLERSSPLRSRQKPQLMVPRLCVWDSKSMTIPPLLQTVPPPQLGQRIQDPGCVCSSASLMGPVFPSSMKSASRSICGSYPTRCPGPPAVRLCLGCPLSGSSILGEGTKEQIPDSGK